MAWRIITHEGANGYLSAMTKERAIAWAIDPMAEGVVVVRLEGSVAGEVMTPQKVDATLKRAADTVDAKLRRGVDETTPRLPLGKPYFTGTA